MERTSREAWAKRVERWKDSGLTAAEYAAETGIRARSLVWWKWRLSATTKAKRGGSTSKSPGRAVATAMTPMTFVEMTAAVTTEPIEVVLPSSVRIRVPAVFDAGALARVLDVLERRV